MAPEAINGNRTTVDPRSGVVPIMQEVAKGKLKIVGTGFYITRYGLFMTAEHVLSELADINNQKVMVSYICHAAGDNKVHLRRILSINLYKNADLAIGQADNYKKKYPKNPLMNMRGPLSSEIPSEGEKLITYAYPENKIMDFTQNDNIPIISSDYYEGNLLKYVSISNHPNLPYPHFETSIKIKSGASGGPVFYRGRIIGVNCRGWDFSEANDGDLSYIVPIVAGLELEVSLVHVPEISWEYQQIPEEQKGGKLTIEQLVRIGHIDMAA